MEMHWQRLFALENCTFVLVKYFGSALKSITASMLIELLLIRFISVSISKLFILICQ
jgi:hypothetical protein